MKTPPLSEAPLKKLVHRSNLFDPQPEQSQSAKLATRKYTRFVSAMKLVLPAAALILVALVFLLPNLGQDDDGISLEYVNIALNDDKLAMTKPRFLSSDKGSQQYVVTADTATQHSIDAKTVDLTNLQADITLGNGQWLSLSAPQGTLETQTGLLDLSGGIEIFSDNGNQLFAKSARVNLKTKTIESPDGMKGHGPMGEITADRLEADQLKGTLKFAGHVKMTIYP